MKRPALGQVASLGTLYDARVDTFVRISMFNGQIPDSAITRTYNHTTTFEVSGSDSLNEKFSQMGINNNLKASFLAGWVDVTGSGSYLSSTRDSSRDIQASMHHRITTQHEALQFMSPDLRNVPIYKFINDGFATHVVAEVTWGAHTVVMAQHQLSEHDSKTETELRSTLKAELNLLQACASGGGGACQGPPNYNFNVRVYSDVLPDDREPEMFTTFEGAYGFVIQVPQYILQSKGGQGKPLTYTLLPLNFIRYFFPMAITVEIPTIELSMDIVEGYVQLFSDFRHAQLVLSEHQKCIKEHRNCVPPKHIQHINELKARANRREATLNTWYSRTLMDTRSGQIRSHELLTLLERYSTGDLSPAALVTACGGYADKMHFFDLVVTKGAKYIGFTSGTESLPNGGSERYVFRFNWDSQHRQPAFEENVAVLLELFGNTGPDRRLHIIIKDCDATGETVEKPYISFERGDEIITKDFAEERKELADKCLMNFIDTDLFEHGHNKRPIKMGVVRIPCPGKGCSPGMCHDWICSKCRALVSFGYDEFLYCDCGRGRYKYWSFMCRERTHDTNWSQFASGTLLPLLEGLEPFDALNILILGETGVGKSTFINAFVNYLTFDTLADAMSAKELNCIIPFSFSTQVVDEADSRHQFVQTTVSMIIIVYSPLECAFTNNMQIRAGKSKNEADGSKGQSATQKTLVHTFQVGSYTVRLFDTPGIGDTRGASQDTENMADILSVLAHYDKIHGILILLKPNNARLTLMFRFCIKELLTHLHRDATRNMVFGFTNTRGSNYKPGDTFEPLKSELACNPDVDIGLYKDTVYCFDSESFRYLAAHHQGVDLGDQADYSQSWEKSAQESQRLMIYFQKLMPHLVKNTISLNETRNMITGLTKPMAEIMQTISDTIKVNQEHIKSLSEDKLKKEDLERQLYVTIKTLNAHPIDQPRTVCSDPACVDHQDDGTDPNRVNLRVVYKTRCHNPCYLDNVPADEIAHPSLIKCTAFRNNNGFCKKCTHSWQSHLHVLYELRPGEKTYMSEDTRMKLNAAVSDMERKEIAIAEKEAFIAAIKAEHEEIEQAAIRFCLFLKKNSITPYNDATLDYLAFMIKEEQGKVAAGGNPTKLDSLERYRNQYQEQVKILTERMQKGSGFEIWTEQQVRHHVDQLYLLKYYGSQLQQIKTVVKKTHGSTFREESHPVRIKSRSRTREMFQSCFNEISLLFSNFHLRRKG